MLSHRELSLQIRKVVKSFKINDSNTGLNDKSWYY